MDELIYPGTIALTRPYLPAVACSQTNALVKSSNAALLAAHAVAPTPRSTPGKDDILMMQGEMRGIPNFRPAEPLLSE